MTRSLLRFLRPPFHHSTIPLFRFDSLPSALCFPNSQSAIRHPKLYSVLCPMSSVLCILHLVSWISLPISYPICRLLSPDSCLLAFKFETRNSKLFSYVSSVIWFYAQWQHNVVTWWRRRLMTCHGLAFSYHLWVAGFFYFKTISVKGCRGRLRAIPCINVGYW